MAIEKRNFPFVSLIMRSRVSAAEVLRNTELIYCDEMAPQFLELGFKGAVTEGAKHILGWKSPTEEFHIAGVGEFF